MTDEELRTARATWIEVVDRAGLHYRDEVLAIIDAALSARAELAALRESEALLNGHCNARIAERDEAVAELELWRSTKTGRHENEARKQLGQVYRHKLDAGPYQEIGVVEVNAAQKALSDALADGDNVRRLLTALETELETARAEKFERRLVESKKVPGALPLGSSEFRALAPLDPALMIVEKADYDALVSYPCAVAFDASRAGWSVASAVGVDFELDESRKAVDLRAQAVVVQAAIRLCQRAAKRCRDAADGSTYSAEWIERAKGHESDAAEIAELAPPEVKP